MAVHKVSELRTLTNEQLITEHDSKIAHYYEPEADYYLNEIFRRDAFR